MLIESTSIRTVIDLLESLRKNSFTASAIRLSYTVYGGTKKYVTFNSLDDLKQNYLDNYDKNIKSKTSPFTADPMLAQGPDFITTVSDLITSNNYYPEVYMGTDQFFCNTGSLVTLESFNLQSYLHNYNFSFLIKDVTSQIKIVPNSNFDLRTQVEIKRVLDRFQSSVSDLVSIYIKIYGRLKFLFEKGNYVELCYAVIGYVEFTFELYKLFFVINKKPISSGITLDVLKKMYLKKT
jgi:hypothetical protein